MLKPEFTGQFKKDYKLAVKRGCDPQVLSWNCCARRSLCRLPTEIMR